MAEPHLHAVLHHLRGFAADALPDRALLERFVSDHDGAAFLVLVERHGPMVLGLCRRVLRDGHDAEDACQAAFLVLARKAASVRDKDALAAWLHGVAFHIATNLRRARRRRREVPLPDPAPAGADGDVSWREVRAAIDEELARLPELYRAPLVLCYLEGRTRDEAARLLGWGVATLRGRLERGRLRLRARLSRRGFGLPAVLLAGAVGEGAASALPPALVVSMVKAATLLAGGHAAAAGAIAPRAVALTEGEVRAMLLNKIKAVAGVLVVLAAVAAGAGLLAYETAARDARGAAASGAPPAGAGAKKDDPPAEPPVPGSVDALEVVKVFRANAALAVERFQDKRVLVRGRMVRITGGDKVWTNEEGKPKRLAYNYVLEMESGEGPGGAGLSFQFLADENSAAQKRLARFLPGQVVTVEAECKGWLPEKNRPDAREWIYFWDSALPQVGRK